MLFHRAIVKRPAPTINQGLSQANLGLPDYSKAIQQHTKYVNALELCGLSVEVLADEPSFPDSCFIEDVAICTHRGVVICNPGAPSRKNETDSVQPVLRIFFSELETIQNPGTLDGGDVLQVGNTFYIGISNRTNESGAQQLSTILTSWGFSCFSLNVGDMLHLKSGISWLGDRCLLMQSSIISHHLFKDFDRILVQPEEAYAANAININEKIFIAKGFPKLEQELSKRGYDLLLLEMSEFQKLDGGLSCLSLRF